MMRTRLRGCTYALNARCGRCSAVQQLCSALHLINPWTCILTSGCTPLLASASRHMQYSSSSCDAGSGSRPDVSHVNSKRPTKGQHNRKASDSARTMLQQSKPPDDRTNLTALAGSLQEMHSSNTHGLRSRAALNAAVAAAAAAEAVATVAAPAAVACGTLQTSSAESSKAATPTAWDRSAGAGLQQQQQQKQQQKQQQQQAGLAVPADNSSARSRHMLTTSDANSGGSVASNGGSLGVPGDDACFTSHPLPSYALNDEEQDSFAKAKDVVNQLQSLGYKALIVGGWVRDKYLDRRASDIDISTNATPWELKKLFRHVVELPRSTVKVTHQGEVLEVTCFRGISRAASMFSVAMDAARRDFTINALYYDPITDQVLDCVGGVEDAKQRVLRLTGDSVARLEEDPLRVLRCVRFVTVLGLRMAPATAQAVKQHAHLCSIQNGLPPRRIWLELCKLRRADQQQAGSWAVALKLCYHLGLLQHIFPWLQQEQPGSTQVHAIAAQQQAVLVAERLGHLWRGGNIPLGLMVAATLHPAASNSEQACQQLESYFSNLPDDLAVVRTFLKGAQLTHSGSATSNTSSEDDAWVHFYASPHASTCLDILAAWIPDAVAGSFQQLHQERMWQLRGRITRHRRLLEQEHDQQAGGQHQVSKPLLATASSEALLLRRIRQKVELTAAIQALMGEQEQQAEQDKHILM